MRDLDDVCTVNVSSALDDDTDRSQLASSLHRQIEDAISAFGQDVLTAREQAVVQLILRGLSSKVVANELQIALKTEKVHRRNLYAKLGVNSHALLFAQFLQFLSASLESPAPIGFCELRRSERRLIDQLDGRQPRAGHMRTGSKKDVAAPRHAVLRDARRR